uniref:Peptidyl-tRNA hydrolase ICT1, mitochondrial n=1 Tax=Lygus hesperus TaxID=30085 RepID=A0A0A9Z8T1_LYGHE
MLLDASEPPDAALPNSGLGRQIIATTFISLVTLNTGLATGWLSPMTLKLQSDDSPVGPLTKTQISYLATLPGYIDVHVNKLCTYQFIVKTQRLAVFLKGGNPTPVTLLYSS